MPNNTKIQRHDVIKASAWLPLTIITLLYLCTTVAVAQEKTESSECYQLVFEAWTESWEDIFVVDLTTGHITNLTNSDANWDGNPSWSPDGKQIVFESILDTATADSSTVVTAINADGSNPNIISKDAGFAWWSHDFNQIFFSSGIDRWAWDPSTDMFQKLPAYNPVLLSDGRIGFSSFDWSTSKTTVFLSNQDGTHQTILTDFPERCELDWSPDRTKLVYCYRNKLYTVDVDTGQEQILLTHLDSNYMSMRTPTWSPDGQSIVYSRLQLGQDIEGDFNLHIVNLPSVEDRLLVELEGKELFYPAWSPDGKKIAFLSHNTSEIYLVDSDGSNLQYVVDSSNNRGQTFKWRPQCP